MLQANLWRVTCPQVGQLVPGGQLVPKRQFVPGGPLMSGRSFDSGGPLEPGGWIVTGHAGQFTKVAGYAC